MLLGHWPFWKIVLTKRPIYYIFDGHATHLSAETIQTAVESDVTILKLPAHTSQLLQPLDQSLNKS